MGCPCTATIIHQHRPEMCFPLHDVLAGRGMSMQADLSECRHHEADGMRAHILKLLELTIQRQGIFNPRLGWQALRKPA